MLNDEGKAMKKTAICEQSIVVLVFLLFPCLTFASPGPYSSFHIHHSSFLGMVRIPSGFYRPFYTTKGIDSIRIESFYMDAASVTNAEFLEFVKANPKWRRSFVSPI